MNKVLESSFAIARPFDIGVTNVCKALAVLLLLWHHLAPHCDNSGYFVLQIGQFGKACVSIFLLLSGYGLMKSRRQGSISQVFRIVRLYINFWFVAIVFVVLSVLLFGRTPYSVYAAHPWLNFISELLCLKGACAYNPTWWFMKTILILYIFFPILKRILDWNWMLLIPICLSVVFFKVQPNIWIVPFVFGMICAKYNIFEKLILYRCIPVVAIVFMCAFSFLRLRYGVLVDGFLAVAIVFLVYYLLVITCNHGDYIISWGGVMGKYSMNMFLLHTFVFLYFFPAFFRRTPFLMGYVILLLTSLGCAIALEYLKKLCRVATFLNMLECKIDSIGQRRSK